MRKLDVRITPKMHHLVHYPFYIKLLGPLKQFWCMRFEGKHAFFKTVARTTGNFVNAPLTLAKRHQQWLTNQIRSSRNGSYMSPSIRSPKHTAEFPISPELSYWGQLADVMARSGDLKRFKSLDWVEVNSSKIRVRESIVLLPMNGAIKFKFGLVSEMFFCESVPEPILICQMMRTKRFSQKYQAYEVVLMSNFLAAKLSSLKTVQTYTCREPSYTNSSHGKHYIVTKSNLQRFVLDTLH